MIRPSNNQCNQCTQAASRTPCAHSIRNLRPVLELNDARGVGLRHDGADWPGRMEARGNGAPPQERIQTCQTSPTSCRWCPDKPSSATRRNTSVSGNIRKMEADGTGGRTHPFLQLLTRPPAGSSPDVAWLGRWALSRPPAPRRCRACGRVRW